MTEPQQRQGSILIGLALLAFGLIMLGSNFGWFQFNIGMFFRYFWPLILVAIGLRFIISNVAVYTGLVVVLFGGALAMVTLTPNFFKEQVGLKTEQRQVFNQPLNNVGSLELKLDFGGGNIHVDAGDDAGAAYKATFTDATRIKETVDRQAGKLTATLQQSGGVHFWEHLGRQEAHVSLNPNVPVEFEVDAGASKTDLDFSNVMLKRLKVDSGASATDIKFGSKADHLDVVIDAGASSLDLHLPEDVGVEIVTDTGLSSDNFESFGLIRQGDIYRSANFGGQAKKITIKLDAGASSINLKR